MRRCKVCGEPIEIAIFQNEEYCCDDHRKVLTGEKPRILKLVEISVGLDGFPFTIK